MRACVRRGSLYAVLQDYSVHIDARLMIELAVGIAQGMNYLHRHARRAPLGAGPCADVSLALHMREHPPLCRACMLTCLPLPL